MFIYQPKITASFFLHCPQCCLATNDRQLLLVEISHTYTHTHTHAHTHTYMPSGECEEYELPFQGLVPPDPSFEEMRRLVVYEKRQPTIPNRWHSDEVVALVP